MMMIAVAVNIRTHTHRKRGINFAKPFVAVLPSYPLSIDAMSPNGLHTYIYIYKYIRILASKVGWGRGSEGAWR